MNIYNERIRKIRERNVYVSSSEEPLLVNSPFTIMQTFEPHEVRLANEIADTLKDRNSLALFLTYTRKYKEKFLKDILAQVMAIDESKIRRSRGALFVFLVHQHGAHGNSRS